jgi:parallel beta-helix repeat protein
VKEKMGEDLYLKGVVLAAIFLFIGASVVLSVMGDNSTFGNTIYVDDDAEPSWYDSTHVKTIQAGIDNVSIGDTVYVYSGTYYENVVVDKTINLVGENRDSTVIDGTGFGDVVQLTAHEVSISEFTNQNSGNFKLGECNAGLEVCSCFNTISWNNISDNNDVGIYFLFDQATDNNIISNNIITSNNRFGIYLLDSSYNIINGNCIANNFHGILVGSGTIPKLRGYNWDDPHSNNITGNTIINNYWCGIIISHSYDNYIFENNLTNNEIGIHVEGYYYGSCNNSIYQNNLINNEKGIKLYGLYGGACNNKIYRNNFINNKISSFFEGCNNEWNKNYWDRPRFFPMPIFGMMSSGSISIPWVNFDWYPAQELYKM